MSTTEGWKKILDTGTPGHVMSLDVWGNEVNDVTLFLSKRTDVVHYKIRRTRYKYENTVKYMYRVPIVKGALPQ